MLSGHNVKSSQIQVLISLPSQIDHPMQKLFSNLTKTCLWTKSGVTETFAARKKSFTRRTAEMLNLLLQRFFRHEANCGRSVFASSALLFFTLKEPPSQNVHNDHAQSVLLAYLLVLSASRITPRCLQLQVLDVSLHLLDAFVLHFA